MKAQNSEPQRLTRSPEPRRAHGAAEVVGILRGATADRGGRGVPTGLWKTGWLAQPEGAA